MLMQHTDITGDLLSWDGSVPQSPTGQASLATPGHARPRWPSCWLRHRSGDLRHSVQRVRRQRSDRHGHWPDRRLQRYAEQPAGGFGFGDCQVLLPTPLFASKAVKVTLQRCGSRDLCCDVTGRTTTRRASQRLGPPRDHRKLEPVRRHSVPSATGWLLGCVVNVSVPPRGIGKRLHRPWLLLLRRRLLH